MLTPEEWNNKVAELEDCFVKYDVEVNTFVIKAKTKAYTYKASLSDNFKEEINPAIISRNFHKQTNYHYIENQYGYKRIYHSNLVNDYKIAWDYETACGYAYCDKTKAGKMLKCWSYDINSAFPYAMTKPMPDTTKEPRYDDFIREGEIGFYKSGKATDKVGHYAEIIFPLMASPFTDYVNYYFALKSQSMDEFRAKWKLYLNIPTGCIQRHNIFLRNAIIYYSNEYIKKYIDDDTVYCNVDCIVSTKPRTDLPIGTELGQFDNEHVGDQFKFKDCGIYEWIDKDGNKDIHYRGVNNKCITDIEELDGWFDLYTSQLDYKYNKETRRLEKNVKK